MSIADTAAADLGVVLRPTVTDFLERHRSKVVQFGLAVTCGLVLAVLQQGVDRLIATLVAVIPGLVAFCVPPALLVLLYARRIFRNSCIEISPMTLRVFDANGHVRETPRSAIAEMLWSPIASSSAGARSTPMAFLIDRAGQSLGRIDPVFDPERVAQLLSIRIERRSETLTRADALRKYGITFPGEYRRMALIALGGTLYTFAAIIAILVVAVPRMP